MQIYTFLLKKNNKFNKNYNFYNLGIKLLNYILNRACSVMQPKVGRRTKNATILLDNWRIPPYASLCKVTSAVH